MIDLIKKTVLAGIGATVITKEKIEGLLGEYVDKGKLSATEAKSLADRIVADGRQEYEQVRHDLGQRVQELIKKANLVTREELAALEKRLADHEARTEHAHAKAEPSHAKSEHAHSEHAHKKH